MQRRRHARSTSSALILPDLVDHWAYLEAEWRAAQAAPLSARKALLVALLIDAYVDRLFAMERDGGDILDWRRDMALRAPALGLVMALAAQRDVALVTQAVRVPLEVYGQLSVENFMVSLYNDHSVQKLLIVSEDGERHDAHEVLAKAMAALSP